MKRAVIIALVCLLCGCSAANVNQAARNDYAGAPPEPADGRGILAENSAKQERSNSGLAFPLGFRRGINLGNIFESPEEGWWGSVYDDSYARTIADLGFDFVRMPVSWSTHADANGKIDPAFENRIEHAVGTLLDAGLGVVINIHHFEELLADPDEYDGKLYAMWRRLSERFADLPEDRVAFEILNEPGGNLSAQQWNECQRECIRIIRDTNKTRKIIVQGMQSGAYTALAELVLPKDDNLILSFHYYDPFEFTHQGAEFAELGGKTGIKWGENPIDYEIVKNAFLNVLSYSEATGIPVLLGEFGTFAAADMEYRLKWARFVREMAEQCGFAWAYWEFNSHFGIYDSVNNSPNKLLSALVPAEPLAKTGIFSGNTKVSLALGEETIGPAKFVRNVDVVCEPWSGYTLLDANDGEVEALIRERVDWGQLYIPLDISKEGGGFSASRIELTIRNVNSSVDDFCINLNAGDYEEELLWLSSEQLSGTGPQVTQNTDGTTTLILSISDKYDRFRDRDLSKLRLKIFFESVPFRPADGAGTVGFTAISIM